RPYGSSGLPRATHHRPVPRRPAPSSCRDPDPLAGGAPAPRDRCTSLQHVARPRRGRARKPDVPGRPRRFATKPARRPGGPRSPNSSPTQTPEPGEGDGVTVHHAASPRPKRTIRAACTAAVLTATMGVTASPALAAPELPDDPQQAEQKLHELSRRAE